ncbi:MAG: photosystem reaction center subunit H [Trichodesmium sp. St11_bin5]|nr:photosystem reaction center subunit H [Trichodesmium sp. St11_bin5]
MNKIPEVIKHSQLLKRLVLDIETVEDQGCIEELCLNIQSHQVIGFICKSGFFGRQKKYFTWKQVETIGVDATLVNGKSQPNNLENYNNIIHIIGNEVWTDTGEKVGFIVEYLLNIKTGEIVNYLFKYNGLQGALNSIYLLNPEAISSVGNKRVIVVNNYLDNSQYYDRGVVQKLSVIQNFLQADLVRTREHIDIAQNQAKKLALRFKERAKVMQKKAQEKQDVVTEKAEQKQEYFPSYSTQKKTLKNKLIIDKFSTRIQEVITEAKEKIDGIESQGEKNFNSSKDD